jgi:hypothetical protein
VVDKIDNAQIGYYKQGKNYRRQILIYLKNDGFNIYSIRGLEKSLVDERYFVNPTNWNTPMIFCVRKNNENFKIVKGLSIKNVTYINAYKLYKNKKNGSSSLIYLYLFLALLFLFSSGIIIKGNYLKITKYLPS